MFLLYVAFSSASTERDSHFLSESLKTCWNVLPKTLQYVQHWFCWKGNQCFMVTYGATIGSAALWASSPCCWLMKWPFPCTAAAPCLLLSEQPSLGACCDVGTLCRVQRYFALIVLFPVISVMPRTSSAVQLLCMDTHWWFTHRDSSGPRIFRNICHPFKNVSESGTCSHLRLLGNNSSK